MQRTRPGRWILVALLLLIVASAAVWAAVRSRQAPTAPSAVQVQALLPAGSALRSIARVDLDGYPPLEAAAVAVIPQFPGAAESTYYGIVVAYDLWHRRFGQVYAEPLPAPIPLSVDAGPVLGTQEAAIFTALHEDGSRTYRVVGRVRGRIQVVREATISGPLRVEGSVLVEDGTPRRALVWDGRAFRERTPPAVLDPPPPGVTWRYRARNGALAAQTDTLFLRPRQPVRLGQSGGGPTPIIVPDLRLDVVEQGYRARESGTYTIRILLPFAPNEQEFTLRLVVE